MPMFRSASWNWISRPNNVMLVPNGIVAEREERRGTSRAPARAGRRGGRPPWGDAFLEEELDPVGERDQDAARPGPHRPLPRLHVRDHLALEPDVEQDRDQEREEDDHDLHDEDQPVDPVHQPSAPASASCSTRRRPVTASATKSPASTASVRREPRLVEGHEDGALRDVRRDPARVASLASVRTTTSSPSPTPTDAASSGWSSTNGGRRAPPSARRRARTDGPRPRAAGS